MSPVEAKRDKKVPAVPGLGMGVRMDHPGMVTISLDRNMPIQSSQALVNDYQRSWLPRHSARLLIRHVCEQLYPMRAVKLALLSHQTARVDWAVSTLLAMSFHPETYNLMRHPNVNCTTSSAAPVTRVVGRQRHMDRIMSSVPDSAVLATRYDLLPNREQVELTLLLRDTPRLWFAFCGCLSWLMKDPSRHRARIDAMLAIARNMADIPQNRTVMLTPPFLRLLHALTVACTRPERVEACIALWMVVEHAAEPAAAALTLDMMDTLITWLGSVMQRDARTSEAAAVALHAVCREAAGPACSRARELALRCLYSALPCSSQWLDALLSSRAAEDRLPRAVRCWTVLLDVILRSLTTESVGAALHPVLVGLVCSAAAPEGLIELPLSRVVGADRVIGDDAGDIPAAAGVTKARVAETIAASEALGLKACAILEQAVEMGLGREHGEDAIHELTAAALSGEDCAVRVTLIGVLEGLKR